MVPWYAQAPSANRPDGRWRYERRPGRGIALSYRREASPTMTPPAPVAPHAPEAPPAREPRRAPERSPSSPPPPGPGVRVLCYCGTSFSFDGGSGVCPHCAQLAEWPTVGLVEREMRADLDALLGPDQPVD